MSDPSKNRVDNRPEKYDPLAPQARRTFGIAVVAIIVAGLELIHYGYLIVTRGYWQVYLIVGSLAALIVLAILALLAGRKGNATLGGWLLISGITLLLISFSLALQNIPNTLGLMGLFTIVFIAVLVLPQTQVRWAIFLGVFILVLMTYFISFPVIETVSILSVERLIRGTSLLALVALGIALVLQFRALSLTNKLVVSFLAVAVLVAYSVNTFNQQSTERALTERAGQSLNDLANTQAQAVGDALNTQLDSLTSLSLGSYLQTWVRSANDLYVKDPQRILASLTELDKQWKESLQAGDLESPLINKRRNNEIAQELREYKQVFPSNLDITLTDVYGGLIATTGLEPDYYQGDEDWWLSAYNDSMGEVFISSPVFDSSQNQNTIMMAIPVRDQDTRGVIGVLQAHFSLSEIEHLLASSSELGGVHTDMYIPGQPPQVIKNSLLTTAEENTLAQLRDLASKPFAEANYQGESSYISLASVKPASDNLRIEGLGWWLVAYQNTSDLTAPVQRQTRQAGFLSAIILGIVSALAVLVSQYLSGPIVRLTRIAEKVRSGELTAKAEIESDDEVGRLAFAFNKMTSQLRETLLGLEQSVVERTKELALAGEVGREISHKRDLDLLLEAAVSLIQSNFKLYYTQIYLVDSTGRALLLRSGFGKVGQELIQRGHRLPISSGSINGLAATEKHPVIVSDTATSSFFRANPLLPETRSEMAVPLVVGDRLVGVLDMQSEKPGNFDQDSIPAFQALAGQLAVAVENAALLKEAKQARDELESQSRKMTRIGWEDYLNAIDRSEKIGYFYNQQEIQPIQEAPELSTNHGLLRVPLQVVGEVVGELRLQKDEADAWSDDEISLANGVASQVVRQIDNIRLLSQAEKYREDAERAMRRLTREGWSEYGQSIQNEELGFVYERQSVARLGGADDQGEEPSFMQPISVRGEKLGMVELDGIAPIDSESLSLVAEITERLGAHIENLRLSAQTQSALLETEALYSVSAMVNSAHSYQDILEVFSKNSIFEKADQLLMLGLFDRPMDSSHTPEWIIPAATHSPGEIEIASRYPFSAFEAEPNTLFGEKPVTFTNLSDTHRLDRVTRTLFRSVFNAKSSIILPLRLGQQVIGFIQGYFSTVVDFSDEEQQRLEAIGGQAAVAVQSLTLLERTQVKAQQEQRIREVTAQIYGAVDVETIMQRAVQQVSRVLGTKAYIYLGKNTVSKEKP